MDFAEYAKGIKFNHVQPEDSVSDVEIRNTQIPDIFIWGFGKLLEIPKMSTFAIGSLINKAVRDMPEGQCYVNIGVWHGFSLLAGMLGNPDKKCIGVDNFSEFGGPRLEFRDRYLKARSDKHHFFEMDYRPYFQALHNPKDLIGFYFYDGSHDYASQLQGLRAAEPFLGDGALIMVDDTNWPDPDRATRYFMEASDSEWDIVLDEKTSSNGHPTWWNGILVIQKLGLKAKS